MRFSQALTILASTAVVGVSAYSPQTPRPRFATQPKKTSTSAQKAVAIPLADLGQQQQVQQQDNLLPREDQWISKLDYEGFGKEVTALGKALQKMGGEQDVAHLNKIVSWRNYAAIIGIATLWATPNPLTIVALSTWTYASWTMIAHHTCHGGYNRVDAGKFNSRGFALGSVKRRVMDWLDWMAPEAWNIEHNRLHHYRLNELSDPDLVQRNMGFLRDEKIPLPVKYGVVAFFLPVWKWFYYAPNTYKEMQVAKWKQEGKELPANFDPKDSATVVSLLAPGVEGDALRQVCDPKEFFSKVLGPFFTARLLLLPAPLLVIPGVGPTLFAHAVVNLVAAEL